MHRRAGFPKVMQASNPPIRRHPDRPIAETGGLQPQRLSQIIWGTLAALFVSILTSLFNRDAFFGGLEAALTLPLFYALHSLRRGQNDRAAAIAVFSMAVGVSILIVTSNGLRDEAVVAIPGVLILASMFSTPRYFLVALGWFGAVLIGLNVANQRGWHVNTVVPAATDTLANLVAVIGATSYFIWLTAHDLRVALSRLKAENERIRESHARIDSLAHHDALTGLPNRILARDRFAQAVALAGRNRQSVALLFLDLDNFKSVNDSLGHGVGDLLLCDVANRLLSVLRASDTVSRQGGDEFLIVMGGVHDRETIAATAATLVDRLSAPFHLEGMEIGATCSVGVAVYPEDGDDFDTLLKHADMAMYRAKDSGRNAFRFYDAQMNSNVVETLHLLSGIRSALKKGEFRLHYQPQFDLASGRIVGAEALIRWWHPELGYVPPNRFIPVAERSGLINEIGMWVLREACGQARRWHDEGLGKLLVAVNISPVQFRRDDFELGLVHALQAAQIEPDRIELELTESLLLADSQSLGGLLARLRGMGLHLAIDDFGTGYSNLGYLKRFNFERLKIDQSFVRRMLREPGDESIVRAIIEMAHSLKIKVLAEGIEDAPTLQRLVEMGCDDGQGFLWSPALPAGEFAAFWRRHHTNASSAAVA